MRDFKQMKEFDKKQEAEMLRVAESTLQNLPANVAINCWTTSLVVLEINRSSVLRLNIVHKIGKEPILRIEKDAHFLNAEQESLKKIISKQKSKYSSVILPLYLKMAEERNVFKSQ